MYCALPGCNKPTSGTQLACCKLHHFLLMDFRYSCQFNLQSLISQVSPHICAFSTCKQPPSPGHICCSKQHYLSWLQSSYASLRSDQICKLPSCYRHVFVEEVHADGFFRFYDFCGWKHCQQFCIRNAALVSFGENRMQGHEPSVESYMESLKAYVRDKNNPPRYVEVDEDFFTKHPWDVLNREDVEYCWLIVRCLWKEKDSSKRELITKDNYHWKQQGQISSYNNEISKRYLTYTKLGRNKRGSNEKAFTMLEYTLVNAADFKDYCLVKLSRGRVSQNQARKNAKPDNETCLDDEDIVLPLIPEDELPSSSDFDDTFDLSWLLEAPLN